MTSTEVQPDVARDDAGSTTAEYATCTTAAAGFGLVLYKFLSSPTVQDILSGIFESVFKWPW